MKADTCIGRDGIEADVHRAALAALPEISPARLRRIDELADPKQAWAGLARGDIGATELSVKPALAALWQSFARTNDPQEMAARWSASGIDVIDHCSSSWPDRLLHDPEPPTVLFTRGAATFGGPCVGIVGTRRCTSYGRRVAARLGSDLAQRGVSVISGLAVGIDAVAQQAALESGGDVFAVVGSGLDVVYPSRNRRLWETICDRGRIWSEYAPGVRPDHWHFPARNRIIAALADVVVVVESAAKGGSLHTVDAALERDVPVLAVPGPVDGRASEGTNRLLVQGATPCIDVDDVLVALGLSTGATEGVLPRAPSAPGLDQGCEPDELAVFDALGAEAASLTELVLRSAMPLSRVIEVVGRLELQGRVTNRGGWYEVARR